MDKSIYLCFSEYGIESSMTYVIRSIDLMSLFATQRRDFSLAKCTSGGLTRVAEYSDPCMPKEMGCGVMGSKILLGGGVTGGYQPLRRSLEPFPCKQLVEFETNRANSQGGSFVVLGSDFMQGKVQPLLVFVSGKLYALGMPLFKWINPYCEVYDEATQKWCPLPDPPALHKPNYACTPPHTVSWAVAGTNILVSDDLSSSRFDTADPNQGWRPMYKAPNEMEVSSRLFQFPGFHFHGKTLVVDDGLQFVLFSYGGDCAESISVYLISYDFVHIRAIHPRIQLPRLPSEFLDPANTSYSFLHIKGKRVCLFLSTLVKEKIFIFPYVFDFDIGKTSRGQHFVVVGVCPTHMFECDTKPPTVVNLIGAFLIRPNFAELLGTARMELGAVFYMHGKPHVSSC